ncbi:reticulocyte-binding protein [Plasmodium cynomolgi strain B]|uniref:Reticulocyte-binding protein n=1 Tax=Plasmodium cynomolgi (strain B) TaxID=1120755 RepID=K6UHT7_PLACD|nr:reticulocyte-binding protein [Plasmodium cynomolgi strain B]GAB64413.1 reticulocyte-binding protein [Plasmodium cynomolgi strain B]
MSESKGRIKLKIHLGNEVENKDQAVAGEKGKSVKSTDLKRRSGHAEDGSDGRGDEGEDSEPLHERDGDSCKGRKKHRRDRLEERITSIISKLTRIACICEDKNNHVTDSNSATHSRENSNEGSRDHSREDSRTHSNDNSLDYSREYSREYSRGYSGDNSGKYSLDYSREDSREDSHEYSRDHSKENKNARICRKLTKEMYKYEKSLMSLNNFINNRKNRLDEIIFPNGLIKAVDNYQNPDVWIYNYLLVECKKQSDKYRNLIQNIAAFDSTLKNKIMNEGADGITMPVYASVAASKLGGLPKGGKNYYENVHVPKELAGAYFEELKRRKTGVSQRWWSGHAPSDAMVLLLSLAK